MQCLLKRLKGAFYVEVKIGKGLGDAIPCHPERTQRCPVREGSAGTLEGAESVATVKHLLARHGVDLS